VGEAPFGGAVEGAERTAEGGDSVVRLSALTRIFSPLRPGGRVSDATRQPRAAQQLDNRCGAPALAPWRGVKSFVGDDVSARDGGRAGAFSAARRGVVALGRSRCGDGRRVLT